MRMLSIIASNMLGSAGGLTFFNNPFHQIVVRQRTVPVQPNTTNQVKAKASFGAGVQAWEQATDVTRAAWAAYAQTVTFQGPLGPYHPTGRMLAVAQFQVVGYLLTREVAGFIGDNSMVAPTDPGLLVQVNPKTQALADPGTGFSLSVDNENGESVNVYAERSFKQSAARNFYKGPWVSSTLDSETVADAASSEIDFTDLEDGGVYFVKFRMISIEAGRRYSQEGILRAIAEVTAI